MFIPSFLTTLLPVELWRIIFEYRRISFDSVSKTLETRVSNILKQRLFVEPVPQNFYTLKPRYSQPFDDDVFFYNFYHRIIAAYCDLTLHVQFAYKDVWVKKSFNLVKQKELVNISYAITNEFAWGYKQYTVYGHLLVWSKPSLINE